MLLLSIGGNAEKTEALKLQAFISAIIWMRVHFFSLKKKKSCISCISPASQVLQNIIGKCLKEVLQDSEMKRGECTFLPAVTPCSRTFPTGLYGWFQK